jgi:hypothetical protein
MKTPEVGELLVILDSFFVMLGLTPCVSARTIPVQGLNILIALCNR